jgi:hypothetical protein
MIRVMLSVLFLSLIVGAIGCEKDVREVRQNNSALLRF